MLLTSTFRQPIRTLRHSGAWGRDKAKKRQKKSTQKAFIFPRNLPPKDLIAVFISECARKEGFCFSTTC